MKAGILAAGKGERLVRSGVPLPKPLVPIRGEPLIGRTIRAAARVGVEAVVCVINGTDPRVENYLLSHSWPVDVEIIKKETANSLESFLLLAPRLTDGPFLLFTVDAVFRLSALERFVTGVHALPAAHAVLALTRFVDDENPLRARVARLHRVEAMGEQASGSPFVTAGFYWLRPSVLGLLDAAASKGLRAFREFLCLLPESPYPTFAVAVSRTLDIDDREDVEKAELYLRGESGMVSW
jgi:NDP-sugar pyrophosphorylase family protein